MESIKERPTKAVTHGSHLLSAEAGSPATAFIPNPQRQSRIAPMRGCAKGGEA